MNDKESRRSHTLPVFYSSLVPSTSGATRCRSGSLYESISSLLFTSLLLYYYSCFVFGDERLKLVFTTTRLREAFPDGAQGASTNSTSKLKMRRPKQRRSSRCVDQSNVERKVHRPIERRAQGASTNSTSKWSTAPPGMSPPPAPRSPYPKLAGMTRTRLPPTFMGGMPSPPKMPSSHPLDGVDCSCVVGYETELGERG